MKVETDTWQYTNWRNSTDMQSVNCNPLRYLEHIHWILFINVSIFIYIYRNQIYILINRNVKMIDTTLVNTQDLVKLLKKIYYSTLFFLITITSTNLCTLVASHIPIYFMIGNIEKLFPQRQDCWCDWANKPFSI